MYGVVFQRAFSVVFQRIIIRQVWCFSGLQVVENKSKCGVSAGAFWQVWCFSVDNSGGLTGFSTGAALSQ